MWGIPLIKHCSIPRSSIVVSQNLSVLSDACIRSLKSSGDSRTTKRITQPTRGGFSGSNLPPSETSISYLSAVWCMNVALMVLVYYGVAWLCKVEAGLTSRCHLVGHGKHRNFFGADEILPNDAMTGMGDGGDVGLRQRPGLLYLKGV